MAAMQGNLDAVQNLPQKLHEVLKDQLLNGVDTVENRKLIAKKEAAKIRRTLYIPSSL